MFITFG